MSLQKNFAKTIDLIQGPLLQIFPEPTILPRSNVIQDYKVISVVAKEAWQVTLTIENGGVPVDLTSPALTVSEMRVSAWEDDTVTPVVLQTTPDVSSDLANGIIVLKCPKDALDSFWATDFKRNPFGSIVIDFRLETATERAYFYDRINVIDDEYGGSGSVAPNSKNYLQEADVQPQVLDSAAYIAPVSGGDVVQKDYADAVTATVQGNLDTHIANLANPHAVTADQVGRDTEQWNADRIRSTNVDLTGLTSGDILGYNGSNIVPVTPSGLPTGTTGDILYNNAGVWTVLNPGSNGQLLKSTGALSAPEWANVAGTGDVVGPASSTDDVVAVYDGTTGKLLKDSSVVVGEIVKRADIISTGTDVVQLGVKGSASHTVNIFEVRDSGDNVLASFDKDGNIISPNIKLSNGAISGLDIDWSTNEAYRTKAISSNETFTFSNVKQGATIVLDITSSSGALLTLPGSCTVVGGGSFTADTRNIITITANNAGTEQLVTFATV